jgi:hypothetical protein
MKMTWTCEQIEARLSDYLDGVLTGAEQTAFDTHVSGCERCAPMVASVSQLLSGLHSMEQLEAPPRLVYNVLDKTLGPRESGWRAVLAWFRGVGAVRFAYGAVSVAATLMIFVTASGFNWRHPKMADLRPANIYRKADSGVHLVYARGTKFVSDLRVVSEIQSRMRDDQEIPTNQERIVPETAPEKQPGRSDGSQPSSPKQQNRANDIGRRVELFAMEMPVFAGRLGGAAIVRRLP